ncbi:MAG: hypothetical protein IJ142_10845 [Bacteroidaceae bacterium]|nr:hypothetical protein [Bacteroidaceae bacterium]
MESRKAQFWKQCQTCAAHHNARRGDRWDWPEDGVEEFFNYWKAVNKQGQMRWEMQPYWDISSRMGSYMKRRRWLESIYEAHLEKARGKKRQKSLEQVRAEAQDTEAQSAYDRYFEEKEKEEIKK